MKGAIFSITRRGPVWEGGCSIDLGQVFMAMIDDLEIVMVWSIQK